MNCIPIFVVATLPVFYQPEYWYHLPSHVQTPQPWTMRYPEYLRVPVPFDATLAYVTWNDTKTAICNVTCREGYISWWGDAFNLGLSFADVNALKEHR